MSVIDQPAGRALLMCADLAGQLADAEARAETARVVLDACAALARSWQQVPGDDGFSQATRIAGAELASTLAGDVPGWGGWLRAALGARIAGMSPPPG